MTTEKIVGGQNIPTQPSQPSQPPLVVTKWSAIRTCVGVELRVTAYQCDTGVILANVLVTLPDQRQEQIDSQINTAANELAILVGEAVLAKGQEVVSAGVVLDPRDHW